MKCLSIANRSASMFVIVFCCVGQIYPEKYIQRDGQCWNEAQRLLQKKYPQQMDRIILKETNVKLRTQKKVDAMIGSGLGAIFIGLAGRFLGKHDMTYISYVLYLCALSIVAKGLNVGRETYDFIIQFEDNKKIAILSMLDPENQNKLLQDVSNDERAALERMLKKKDIHQVAHYFDIEFTVK